jgi:hypothetical protein
MSRPEAGPAKYTIPRDGIAATRQVLEWARRGESRYVCVATVHSVMEVGERRIEGLPDTMHK